MASTIFGPGVTPGYAITNFRAHYDLTKRFQLAVQIDNLFNARYYTAAQLANTSLTTQAPVGPFSGPYHRPLRGEFPGAECDILFAWSAETSVGRTQSKILIDAAVFFSLLFRFAVTVPLVDACMRVRNIVQHLP